MHIYIYIYICISLLKLFVVLSLLVSLYIRVHQGMAVGRLAGCLPAGPAGAVRGVLRSAKGGAVETGCSGLHYIIGCFTI